MIFILTYYDFYCKTRIFRNALIALDLTLDVAKNYVLIWNEGEEQVLRQPQEWDQKGKKVQLFQCRQKMVMPGKMWNTPLLWLTNSWAYKLMGGGTR